MRINGHAVLVNDAHGHAAEVGQAVDKDLFVIVARFGVVVVRPIALGVFIKRRNNGLRQLQTRNGTFSKVGGQRIGFAHIAHRHGVLAEAERFFVLVAVVFDPVVADHAADPCCFFGAVLKGDLHLDLIHLAAEIVVVKILVFVGFGVVAASDGAVVALDQADFGIAENPDARHGVFADGGVHLSGRTQIADGDSVVAAYRPVLARILPVISLDAVAVDHVARTRLDDGAVLAVDRDGNVGVAVAVAEIPPAAVFNPFAVRFLRQRDGAAVRFDAFNGIFDGAELKAVAAIAAFDRDRGVFQAHKEDLAADDAGIAPAPVALLAVRPADSDLHAAVVHIAADKALDIGGSLGQLGDCQAGDVFGLLQRHVKGACFVGVENLRRVVIGFARLEHIRQAESLGGTDAPEPGQLAVIYARLRIHLVGCVENVAAAFLGHKAVHDALARIVDIDVLGLAGVNGLVVPDGDGNGSLQSGVGGDGHSRRAEILHLRVAAAADAHDRAVGA